MRWPASWGWPGATTILLMALAASAVALASHWQAQARSQRLVRAAQAPRPIVLPTPEPPRLPEFGLLDERIAILLELAPRHGVAIESAEQRLDSTGPVPKLHLALAARGGYADLRAFIDAALLTDPGLGLERLHLQRTTPAAAGLRASLRWVLLLPAPERPRT
jgi:hypothetical protein